MKRILFDPRKDHYQPMSFFLAGLTEQCLSTMLDPMYNPMKRHLLDQYKFFIRQFQVGNLTMKFY